MKITQKLIFCVNVQQEGHYVTQNLHQSQTAASTERGKGDTSFIRRKCQRNICSHKHTHSHRHTRTTAASLLGLVLSVLPSTGMENMSELGNTTASQLHACLTAAFSKHETEAAFLKTAFSPAAKIQR